MGEVRARPGWMRRVGRAAIASALLLLLAIGAVLAWLHAEPGRRWVRTRAEAALTERFGQRVTLGDLEYGFLFRPIVVRDVWIGEPGAPWVTMGEVRLEVDRPALLDRRVHVEALAIRDLEVRLDEWPARPPDLARGLPPIRIDAIAVAGGSVVAPRAALRELEATGRAELGPGGLSLELDAATARLERPGAGAVPLVVGHLALTVTDGTPRRHALSIEAAVHGLEHAGARAGHVAVRASVGGEGADLDTLRGTVAIDAAELSLPTGVGPVDLPELRLRAEVRGAQLAIEELVTTTAGATIVARGGVHIDSGSLEATATVEASPDRVVAAAGAPAGLAELLDRPLALAVAARGNVHTGALDLELAPARIELGGGSVDVRANASLAAFRPRRVTAQLAVADVDVATVTAAAGLEAPMRGTASGDLVAEHQDGESRLRYDLRLRPSRLSAEVHARGLLVPTRVDGSVHIRSGAQRVRVEHSVPLEPGNAFPPRGDRAAPWRLDVRAESVDIDALRRVLPGVPAELGPAIADAHVEVRGSMRRPSARAHVRLRGRPLPVLSTDHRVVVDASTRGGHTLDLRAAVHVGDETAPLFTAEGTAPLSRTRGSLDVEVAMTRRPLSALAALGCRVCDLPGRVEARGSVTGSLERPHLDGTARVEGYRTAEGAPGSTEARFSADREGVRARVELRGGGRTAEIAIESDRPDGPLRRVRVALHASELSATEVLPAALEIPVLPALGGRLSADLLADASVAIVDGSPEIVHLDLAGTAELTGGRFAIPGSRRAYTGIGARVVGDGSRIRLEHLELHESDLEVADRLFHGTGMLELEAGRPLRLDLEMRAERWLLFGAEPVGPADAPAAAVSGEARAVVRFGAQRHAVDVELGPLELRSPDREPTGHAPEIASDGDVVFVDDARLVGVLPHPAAPHRRLPPVMHPIDVHVRLVDRVRFEKGLLDVTATGSLDVTLDPAGARTRGVLRATSGTLRFFGRRHQLRDGTLTFDDARPEGYLDLEFFARPGHDALRDVAASGGSEVVIHMRGRLGQQAPAIGGVANRTLPGATSVYHAGRSRQVSGPGLPASRTVHVLEGTRPMMLGFVAMNAPHLLFLDRLDIWADPSAGVHDYGRIEHVDARRRIAGGRGRLRIVSRPPTPGRSGAEIQVDRVLADDEHLELGIGLRAGDRLGGGAGFYLDWSSR